MWIFGYGSLLWKVDFPYEEKKVGYIKGCHRRFYQHSTDHRGIPSKPGRVVTLIPSDDPDAVVWGAAYKISESNIKAVIEKLDYREKGGYERKSFLFYPKKGEEPFEITTYIGTSGNTNYAGEADIDAIAQQIFDSVGPSGPNIEYVFKLAEEMRSIAPEAQDDHLFEIEAKLKEALAKSQRS